MDLLSHVLGVAKVNEPKTTGVKAKQHQSAEGSTPLQNIINESQDACPNDISGDEDMHNEPPTKKSSKPGPRRGKAGKNTDWRVHRQQFDPPHRQGDGTHWEPGPNADKGTGERDYQRKITRDRLKADFGVWQSLQFCLCVLSYFLHSCGCRYTSHQGWALGQHHRDNGKP
jgi:hypothetical protein